MTLNKWLIIALVLSIIGFWGVYQMNQEIITLTEKNKALLEYSTNVKTVDDLEQEINRLKETIKNLESSKEVLNKEKSEFQKEVVALKNEMKKINEKFATIKDNKEQKFSKIQAVAFFEFNSYDLLESNKEALNKVVAFIKEHNSVLLVIEGHADKQGDVRYNTWLSEKRALVIKNFILKNINKDVPCDIIIKGEGSSKLVSDENKNNRRVNIIAIEGC
jgi:outer membrane protein OmpA-like peptidoglycan-associated protein